MAESSWDAILRNREQYPDTMTIDLNGSQVALGELRGSVLPKGDMTRLTQQWSQRDQTQRQQIEQLQMQLAEALTVTPEPTQRGNAPGQAHGTPELDYSRDPILAPLHSLAMEAHQRGTRTEETIAKLERTLQQLGNQLAQWPVLMTLDKIKSTDEYNVDPQDLVKFAVSRRQAAPNLQDDYALMTIEARVAKERKAAEDAAYAKAKAELAAVGSGVPYMPYGPPRTLALPEPMYQSMDDAEAAALNDPELLGIIMGQG